jgi:hypothetical protein
MRARKKECVELGISQKKDPILLELANRNKGLTPMLLLEYFECG